MRLNELVNLPTPTTVGRTRPPRSWARLESFRSGGNRTPLYCKSGFLSRFFRSPGRVFLKSGPVIASGAKQSPPNSHGDLCRSLCRAVAFIFLTGFTGFTGFSSRADGLRWHASVDAPRPLVVRKGRRLATRSVPKKLCEALCLLCALCVTPCLETTKGSTSSAGGGPTRGRRSRTAGRGAAGRA